MFSNVPHDALASPEMDRVLEILSQRQRRLILYRLKQEETYTLLENSGTLEGSELELYHVHLPKLEATEYVEWNRNTGEVSKGDRYGEVEPLLTLFGDHADELPPEWP
jgi:hypothetical protein